MSSRTFSPVESDSSLLSTIKRIHAEYEQHEISPEKLRVLSDKLAQLWMRLPIAANASIRNREGYRIVEFLEQLLAEKTINDRFLMLVINTLAKNESFYQILLSDHIRFQPLFSSTARRPGHLMRYIELLYFNCPSNLISTVGLKFYRLCTEMYCLRYLRQTPRDLEWLAAFSLLVDQFHQNTTKTSSTTEWIFAKQKEAVDYCICVIDTLLHHQLNPNDLKRDVKFTETIIKAVGAVWDQHPSEETTSQKIPSPSSQKINGSVESTDDRATSVQLRSIEYLFEILSDSQPPQTTFSPAVFSLFPRIQLDAIDSIIRNMYSTGRLTGERLTTMVKALIVLLDAPVEFAQQMPFEIWIVGLCMTLISFKHHDCVLQIIDETASFLIDHLFRPQTADNAGQILFWYVRYDNRVQTFRLILNRLPTLFEQLKTTPNDDLKSKLIDLCHMGVALHPDYDMSNETILKQIIRDLPQPDLNVLLNHRTVHARLHSMAVENDLKIKNRVGIINLGNTCYINSVLQALYQCTLFRKYILEQQFTEQAVLRELQIVFAQLSLSKRPYINAINLVKIARPAWFIINEQQDCAEFLGYLLDTIKDEEKNLSSDAIQRLFTIRTCQINRCQRCSHQSVREESTNYLFLPIPASDNQHENLNYNQSATPISVMRNGLKFYAASNGNSLSADRARSPTASNSLNLQSVFDCYFQKEDLKDDNQYRCEHCRSLQDAERSTILQTAPEYLVLSLNRFEYDKQANVFRKVFTKMDYPKVLGVHVYPSRTSPTLIRYCLVLIIVHTGYTLHGGHYYVYARGIKPSDLSTSNHDEQDDRLHNDEWFLFNDDLVTSSSYEAIMENCAQYTSATPYVLFYQRMAEIEGVQQIRVHDSLIERIQEDNASYERELEK